MVVRLSAALFVSSLAFAPASALAIDHDIVIVLDNSASMRRNDPEHLAKQAVQDFVRQLDSDSRVAIVIFDTDARLVQELSYATPTTRPHILETLREVTYWGRHTNSAVAMERAIYHLRWEGRDHARRSILFLTDGTIETGSEERNEEMARWLEGELATTASEEEIRIFGIAFTEEADFRTIQSLSRKTGGEYLRAFSATDLPVVFERMNRIMSMPTASEFGEEETEALPEAPVDPAGVAEADSELPPDGGEASEETLTVETVAPYAGVAVFAVALLAFLIYRRGRSRAVSPTREAVLEDVDGATEAERHVLGYRTVIGRKPEEGDARKDTSLIVVDRKQVSRQHAIIVCRNDEFWIADTGTRNGTYVNDERLKGERVLRHGDRIRFEAVEFDFKYTDLENDPDQTVFSDQVVDEDGTILSDGRGLDVREDSDIIRSLSP